MPRTWGIRRSLAVKCDGNSDREGNEADPFTIDPPTNEFLNHHQSRNQQTGWN